MKQADQARWQTEAADGNNSDRALRLGGNVNIVPIDGTAFPTPQSSVGAPRFKAAPGLGYIAFRKGLLSSAIQSSHHADGGAVGNGLAAPASLRTTPYRINAVNIPDRPT